MVHSFRATVAQARRHGDLYFAALLSQDRILKAFGAARAAWQGWIYTPAVTVWVFLSQCLSPDHSCRDAVARLIAWRLTQGLPACSADTGAYCTARSDLPEEALRALVRETGKQVEDRLPDAWLWQGRKVRVVDGSTITMPDTQEDQAAYPQHRAQKPGCGFPIARILVIFSLSVGTVLEAAIDRYRGKLTGENSLLRRLYGALDEGDIILADRYFSGWFDLALPRKRGIDIVVRKHQARGTDFRTGQRLGHEDHLIFWLKPKRPAWMSAEKYAPLPEVLARPIAVNKQRANLFPCNNQEGQIMCDKPKLLVVDDESVICLACRRVFSRQGFQVEENTDSREGLRRAMEQDYAGILLDIKMPEMDGIQFLEELRKVKPDVPVLIMTGYPSIPNAASAVRLGAADYVTKPFTPEDITQSVLRMLGKQRANGKNTPSTFVPPAVGPAGEAESRPAEQGEFLFLNETWLRLEEDGSAAVGAVLAQPRHTTPEGVRLPRIGEVVYQGLPLAGVTMADKSLILIPSTVSGVVVGVNESLHSEPSLLFDDPCGDGWIACVCTTRADEEVARCNPRRVLLATTDEAFAKGRSKLLTSLGCQVEVLKDGEAPALQAETQQQTLLVLDADSFAETGPQLVAHACLTSPTMRIVVVTSSTSQWEAAYRKQRIFYYAVEPFGDSEIVEILNSAFQRQAWPTTPPQRHASTAKPIGGIRITNKNCHKVELLASPGMSCEPGGLGWRITQKLTQRAFPITTTLNAADVTPNNIIKVAGTCDRVMVLTAEEIDRLPGALVRDTKAEFGSTAGEKTSRVTTLQVQPDPRNGGFIELDGRITEALAEHIVHEMSTY